MTALLEKVLKKVQKLPPAAQDAIASIVLDELESERKWNELFAKSSEKLAKLAEKALADFEAGRTFPLDLESDNLGGPS